MSAYLVALLTAGLILDLLLLPALGWLYFGGAAKAGLLEEVPYQREGKAPEEQRLYVIRGQEERTVRIPVTGEASLMEEIAAGRIVLTVNTQDVQDTDMLTITADTDCLTSAALYRSGHTLSFEMRVENGLHAELTQTPEGQLIRLSPVAETAFKVILIDVRGSASAAQSAEKIRELLRAQEDLPALVYVIGNEEEPLTAEGYEAFIRQCAPDIYLRIADGSEGSCHALCNPRYFLPGLDSVVLAQTLLQEMLRETGDETTGVLEAETEDPLRSFEIPAAEIVLKDLTEETAESRLEYLDTVATGLARGLTIALTE